LTHRAWTSLRLAHISTSLYYEKNFFFFGGKEKQEISTA
jgi:hypothetical protein